MAEIWENRSTWTQLTLKSMVSPFDVTFTKSFVYTRVFVVRCYFDVRWKAPTLAHPTVGQSCNSDPPTSEFPIKTPPSEGQK